MIVFMAIVRISERKTFIYSYIHYFCVTYYHYVLSSTHKGFDWLLRLGKRGEKFDIVILDPPATSVGKKKKRWSVKKDMAELVTLAAPLVKQGGLLFTTNNCSTLHPSKFAKACKLGLDSCKNSKNSVLEKVVPMPCDFPSISTSPVTNLVWRVQ